jgi:prepilin-type N-terminal cleavage/methylation domain-containing protein
MNNRRSSGFTLIELLVVIAIIGILSSVVLASLNTARSKGRDAARQESIRSIQNALELYYTTNGFYPASGGASSPNGGWSSSNDNSWTTLQTALAPYIPKLPTDPAQSSSDWAGNGYNVFSYYSLGYGCSQKWYMIVYHLESSTEPNRSVTPCSGMVFNYGSSNASIVTVGMNGSGY